MKTILLTGLTGVLGAAIAPALQEKGYRVICIVRGGKSRAHGENTLHGIPCDQLINGDVTEPFCGISDDDLSRLANEHIDKFVHIAASVKFDAAKADETWEINNQGTKNVIALTKKLGITEFHHTSTAYADTKRNPYENSKASAEEVVKHSGLKFSIYRPSVIVGDSETGKINDFNGFYGFFIGFHFLAENRRAKRGHNGAVDLPVSVICSPISTINLVSINWLSKNMVELIDMEPIGETYNLTHNTPPLVQWVMEEGFKAINIKGVRFVEPNEKPPTPEDKLTKIFQGNIDNLLTRYLPYITEEKVFDLTSTKKRLNEFWTDPPPVTSPLIEMLLKTAIRENFGRE